MTAVERVLLALVLVQAAHSVEEYAFRLYDVFPPAQFVIGIFTTDRQRGFVVVNTGLVAFGLWCVRFPIHRRWRSWATFAWLWVAIELVNGIVHPLWSIAQGSYTPGVATAPVLFVLAVMLALRIRNAAA